MAIKTEEINPEDKRSLMSFYAIENDTVHEFLFRVLEDTKNCQKLYSKYQKIIEHDKKIRLVGIELGGKEGNFLLKKERVPKKFKQPKYLSTWFFVRFHTANTCQSYFNDDCKPENYWGGLFPQK